MGPENVISEGAIVRLQLERCNNGPNPNVTLNGTETLKCQLNKRRFRAQSLHERVGKVAKNTKKATLIQNRLKNLRKELENDAKIRRRIKFNKNDAKYENRDKFYQNPDKNVFDFATNVNTNDRIAVECSSILSNMIQSIEFAVNETNFTNQDLDIDYVGTIDPKLAMNEYAARKTVEQCCQGKPNTKADSSKNKVM